MPPPHNNFSMYTLLLISTVLTLVVPSSSFGINSHNFVRLLLIAGMQTIKISIIESAKRRKKRCLLLPTVLSNVVFLTANHLCRILQLLFHMKSQKSGGHVGPTS